MNLPAKAIHKLAASPWTVLISTVGSILGLGVLLYDRFFNDSTFVAPIVLFISSTILYVAVSMYSVKVREDNLKLQEIAESFREINSIYKDRLFELFFGDDPIIEREELQAIEKSTITSICQRISQIYSKLISKDCVVSVKLLTKVENNIWYVTSYARSINDCERDKTNPKTFEVNTGQNTAFDMALMNNTTGGPTCFYSGDLKKHKNYHNQRPNWAKHYQSAIVVPIRCLGVERKPRRNDIGFLCIDTKSRNRLNNGHHVTMATALADQIYNCISLTRGKYRVAVIEGKRDAG